MIFVLDGSTYKRRSVHEGKRSTFLGADLNLAQTGIGESGGSEGSGGSGKEGGRESGKLDHVVYCL